MPEHPTCMKCEVRNPGPGEWFYCLSTGKQIRPSRHCAACDSHEPGGPVTVIPGIRRTGEESRIKRILRNLNESDTGAEAPSKRAKHRAQSNKSEGNNMTRKGTKWWEPASETIEGAPDHVSLAAYFAAQVDAGETTVTEISKIVGSKTPSIYAILKRAREQASSPADAPSAAPTVPVDTEAPRAARPVVTPPHPGDRGASTSQERGSAPVTERRGEAAVTDLDFGTPSVDIPAAPSAVLPGMIETDAVEAYLMYIGAGQSEFWAFVSGWRSARQADAA